MATEAQRAKGIVWPAGVNRWYAPSKLPDAQILLAFEEEALESLA